MKSNRKGLRDIKTPLGSGLRSQPRVQQDGMRDDMAQWTRMTQLILEKARLIKERKIWQGRMESIDARLCEIAAIERSFQQWVAEEGLTLPAQVAEGRVHEEPKEERPDEVILRY